jgi:hypothetical protein
LHPLKGETIQILVIEHIDRFEADEGERQHLFLRCALVLKRFLLDDGDELLFLLGSVARNIDVPHDILEQLIVVVLEIGERLIGEGLKFARLGRRISQALGRTLEAELVEVVWKLVLNLLQFSEISEELNHARMEEGPQPVLVEEVGLALPQRYIRGEELLVIEAGLAVQNLQ